MGVLKEAGQEAATEYLGDPNASTGQVLEAGAMGGLGQGAFSAGGASVGYALRQAAGPLSNRQGGVSSGEVESDASVTPTTASPVSLADDLTTGVAALSPELQTTSRSILQEKVGDPQVFLQSYRQQYGNVIDADQMRDMLRNPDGDGADFTLATDPIVAALSREATRHAFDALPEGGNVVFLAGGPASGKSPCETTGCPN